MIAFVKGEVVRLLDGAVILDLGQVGCRIFLSGRDLAALPGTGKKVKLHTYLNVKEDAMQLFGFLNEQDLEVFRLLIGVSGIGPKAALGILGSLTADDLRFAVLAEDAKTLARAPGIGLKTARKMILELKDKLSLEEAFEKKIEGVGQEVKSAGFNEACQEAVEALAALGYSSSDALKAVRASEPDETMSTEDILKAALKQMARS